MIGVLIECYGMEIIIDMSSYWEKQEQYKKLVEKFEASKTEYMGGSSSARHPPSPPMSPFEDKLKR